MSEPISSVVRVAATPEQAKLLVALLQAEGIPATVEGDSLADEVAVSRRMMNLGGTKVLVPTASLPQARAILDALPQLDADELAAQALAATDPEVPPARWESPTARSRTSWFTIAGWGLAVVFLGLWLSEVEAEAAARHPFARYEFPSLGTMREVRLADGQVIADFIDEDLDGHFEAVVGRAAGGERIRSVDADHDLRFETVVEGRGALTYTWRDGDRDGLFDTCAVADESGKIVQQLRYVAGEGFEIVR